MSKSAYEFLLYIQIALTKTESYRYACSTYVNEKCITFRFWTCFIFIIRKGLIARHAVFPNLSKKQASTSIEPRNMCCYKVGPDYDFLRPIFLRSQETNEREIWRRKKGERKPLHFLWLISLVCHFLCGSSSDYEQSRFSSSLRSIFFPGLFFFFIG